MAFNDDLVAELKQESASTKRILERVPFDHREWKPHEKSFSLGRLATHVAEIPHWISRIITVDDWDFATRGFSVTVAGSRDELLKIFDSKLSEAIEHLASARDQDLQKTWVVRNGDLMRRELIKKQAIRSWGFSHLVHHRGQLSVYLRLLNVAVPGMYGPSADER